VFSICYTSSMGRIALAVLALSSCSNNPYARDLYEDVTSYRVHATARTPKGVAVAGALDLVEVDRRLDAVEACLARTFPGGVLDQATRSDGHCLYPSFETRIARSAITVLEAPDWRWTAPECVPAGWDAQQQFGAAPAPLCAAKGIVATPACPCQWRGAIQGDSDLVTTPNMHLLAGDLIRLVTSCNNPWNSQQLAGCYIP
jgi:hypothetical protein